MAALTVETQDTEKPILLLFGKNPLIKYLIDESSPNFKIAQITNEESTGGKDFYRIKEDSSQLINNLEENIEYAVIFLSNFSEKQQLELFVEKLKNDSTKTAIVIPAEKIEEFSDVLLEYKKTPNFYFLVLGDLYSEKEDLGATFDVAHFIGTALKDHKVVLTGNDLAPIFPIYYQDALSGINQVLLGPKSTSKFYLLFYSHPQTVISAIHVLRRVEPDLEMNYEEGAQGIERITHESLEEVFKNKITATPATLDKYLDGFEKSIPNFSNYSGFAREVKQDTRTIASASGKKIRVKKPPIKIFTFIALALFLYAVASVIFLALGIGSFKKALADFNQGDYKSATTNMKNAQAFLQVVSPNISILGNAARVIGQPNLNLFFDNFGTASTLLTLATKDIDTFQKLPTGITNDEFNNLIADAFYLYFTAEKFKLIMPNQTLNSLLTPELTKSLTLSSVAARVLGFEGEKNYLVLFQNNGELRPTGGFIGSIGELKVKNGKAVSLELRDVYDLDGKLKDHVEPYWVIRRYLQPHLYLRDSNFDPNFQNSASAAAQLYNLESGNKIDGVIAINYDAIKQIIGAVGPIKLASYNKTIDQNNAFDFLESTIDNNFFPGSTQKKDVLQALYDALLLKIEGNQNNTVKIARLIPKLMEEKNILFAFNQGSTQSIFSAEGFAGDGADFRKVDTQSMNDYLAINEANIGVDKANIYLTRDIDYEVTVGSDKVTSAIDETINNTSPKSLDYKAYVRVIVPFGSRLTAIKINGGKQETVPAVTDFATYEKRTFKAPAGLEVDQGVQDGHTYFGFIINVAKGTKQEIEVDYDNGVAIPTEDIINYSLFLVKQPGSSIYPFSLKVLYSNNFSPQEVKDATLNVGSVEMNKKISTDQNFTLKLIKK